MAMTLDLGAGERAGWLAALRFDELAEAFGVSVGLEGVVTLRKD
jgi:hypothetical protein